MLLTISMSIFLFSNKRRILKHDSKMIIFRDIFNVSKNNIKERIITRKIRIFSNVRRNQKFSTMIVVSKCERENFHDIILRLERKSIVKKSTFERIDFINIETNFEFNERFLNLSNNFEHLVHVKYENQNIVILFAQIRLKNDFQEIIFLRRFRSI